MPGERDDALTPAEKILVRVLAAAIVDDVRAEATAAHDTGDGRAADTGYAEAACR